MNKRLAAETLRRHNKWRRGDDSQPMVDVRLLGDALDYAVEFMQHPKMNAHLAEYFALFLMWLVGYMMGYVVWGGV